MENNKKKNSKKKNQQQTSGLRGGNSEFVGVFIHSNEKKNIAKKQNQKFKTKIVVLMV